MSPRLLASQRAVPSVSKTTRPEGATETSTSPPHFCGKPMSSGESGSTCLTSSPSPRVRNSETRGDSEVPATGGGGGGGDYIWEGRQGASKGGEGGTGAPSRRCGGDESDPSKKKSIWTGFDSPPHAASNKRALQRRKCDFKIIVVFRGGWCTSSHALLKGFVELNPLIKRAGGKVVALSSQSSEQVAITSRDMGLPFQAFGDPTNCLVEEMNDRFNMGCTVCLNDIVTDAYPHGMAQPCVLAVAADDAQDQTSVLYKWDRWQTIGSLRHSDAWTTILNAFTNKSERQQQQQQQPQQQRQQHSNPTPSLPLDAGRRTSPNGSRHTSLDSSATLGGAGGRGGGLQRDPSARAPARSSGSGSRVVAGDVRGGMGGDFGRSRFSHPVRTRPNPIDETAEFRGVGMAVRSYAGGSVEENDEEDEKEEEEEEEVGMEQVWQPRGAREATPRRPPRGGRHEAAEAAALGDQRQPVASSRQGVGGGGTLRGWGSLRGSVASRPSPQGTPGNAFTSSPGERLMQVHGRGGVGAAAPQMQPGTGMEAADRPGDGSGSRWGRRPGGGVPRQPGGPPEATVTVTQQQQQQQQQTQQWQRRQSTGAALPPQHRPVRGAAAGSGGGGGEGERRQQQAPPPKTQSRRFWSIRSSKGVASFQDSDTAATGGGGSSGAAAAAAQQPQQQGRGGWRGMRRSEGGSRPTSPIHAPGTASRAMHPPPSSPLASMPVRAVFR